LAHSRTIFISGIVLLVAVVLLNPTSRQAVVCSQFHTPTSDNVVFKNQKIAVEVASTEAAREKGLSDRPCIKDNQAMEFVFPASDKTNHCFWMKDMRFPIDIIWIDQHNSVLTIAKVVKPDTYPHEFCPGEPTSYVLEMKAGATDRLKMLPGDFIRF